MAKPLVAFADPEAAVIARVKAAYLSRSEAYKPATVTTEFPATALTTTTHVQVELELGDTRDYPVTERAQVRVTCYAGPGKRTDVKRLASLTQTLFYAWAGDATVAGVTPLIGRSGVVTDPTTKNVSVWFLARVNMLAVATA